MLEKINGYKTYLIIILSGILGMLNAGPDPIWQVPEQVWIFDMMLFGGAVRSAMNKIGQ